VNFNPVRLFGARPQKRALDESSELYRALAIYNQTASGFSVNDETALPTRRRSHTRGGGGGGFPLVAHRTTAQLWPRAVVRLRV
jgi:hypothetical protein